MTELQQPIAVESIADRARSLWKEAQSCASGVCVELFVKASLRRRATRDPFYPAPVLSRVLESGLAVRALRAGKDDAGFAAASGLSSEILRWVVDTACADRDRVSAWAPRSSELPLDDRWDLDDAVPPPNDDALTEALATHRQLEWFEEGTTIEILIGAEGWLAGRRRSRVWARSEGAGPRLVAQRGMSGWERLFDQARIHQSTSPSQTRSADKILLLSPEAAAPVAAALVNLFHGVGDGRPEHLGAGWSVSDEPARPDGLTGGSFDDAGFPAASRVLAKDRVWVGRLMGPGHLRRASFREPPTASATNLVMASEGPESLPGSAVVGTECRVLTLSADLWVLELLLAPDENGSQAEKRWVRVDPQALVAACATRLGSARVTSTGPIVPMLGFEGLRL